jgi:phage recombination protein Bet
MANDLMVQTEWTDEQVALVKATICKGATDDELKLFRYQCNRTGLDPFSRQIFWVTRWDAKNSKNIGTIQTGIDGYRVIADRTGKYAGSDEPRFDEFLTEYEHMQTERGNPQTATVTVYKMVGGIRCPFTASCRWEEYYPGDKQGFMWKKMPYLMLAKVAEALALRKAFPQDISGLYIKEEMEQAYSEDTKSSVAIKGAAESQKSLPPQIANPSPPVGAPLIEEQFKKSEIDEKGNADPAQLVLGDASPLKYFPNKLELLSAACKEHGYDVSITKVETGVVHVVDESKVKLGDLSYGRAKLLVNYLKLQEGITDKKKLEYAKASGKGAIQRVLSSNETWEVALAAVMANNPEVEEKPKKSLAEALND